MEAASSTTQGRFNPPRRTDGAKRSYSGSPGQADRRDASTQPASKSAPEPGREILKTIAFDSVGVKKYALQVQKARNGNPFLRIVEGTPLDDGSFRKFDLRIWSEDFERFFKAIDEVRTFIKVHEVRTPAGHVWKPKKKETTDPRR
jgi:hypothetical protein